MKIVFAASECGPFVKTGGLADAVWGLAHAISSLSVSRSLGKILSRSRECSWHPLQDQIEKRQESKRSRALTEKLKVVIVLPKYSLMDEYKFGLKTIPGKILVPIGDRIEEASVYNFSDDLPVYFIGNKKYFDRPGFYRTAEKDFEDNDERFIFFSRAVLEFCKLVDFRPDLIHSHDWQTALIPAYLKTLYRTDAFFRHTATVFSIHNIAYQGLFPKQSLFLSGFGWHDFTPERLEYYGQFSFLKAALVFADKIATVSPTYAREVQKNHELGRGLEGVLQSRAGDFIGILNGLNASEWNPATDKVLAAPFSFASKNLAEKKRVCKRDLQEIARLPVDDSVPLIGMVTRLDPQKGVQRVAEIAPELFEKGVKSQWVILGLGDKNIHDLLTSLSSQYPQQISFQIGFNNELAHKIYAGSDLFFMPSEFEPCGIAQMIAMKYGTIPVVTPVGGLLDTVHPFDPSTGTGFISAEVSNAALLETLEKALQIYRDQDLWQRLVRNAMKQDFSWKAAAAEYLKLYQGALEKMLEQE